MSEIRSMAGQRLYLSNEAVPGTAEDDNFFGASGALKLTPGWEGTRDVFRGGGGKVPTTTIGTDEHSTWDAELAPDFNHLGLVLASRFAKPTTTTPGGGTDARQHVFTIDPDAEDDSRFYTAIWGDAYYTIRGVYGFFQSLGMDIQRGNVSFSTGFVSRAASVLDGSYLPGNEVQTLTITGTPTGGTFTLTYDGQTTTALDFDATAAEVQAALRALSNIGDLDVFCTGGPLPGADVVITFAGTLAQTNVAAITSTDSLTGGSTPESSIATTTGGAAPTDMAVAPMPANMWDVYIDDAWANLGNTQYGGAYAANPNFGDKFDLDAPLNSSIVSYEKPIEMAEQDYTFDMTLRLGATALAQTAAFEAGTKQFFRLDLDTSNLPNPYYIEGSIPWQCSVDFCAEIISRGNVTTAPNSSAVALPLSLVMTKDPTSGNFAQVTLVNTVTAY